MHVRLVLSIRILARYRSNPPQLTNQMLHRLAMTFTML